MRPALIWLAVGAALIATALLAWFTGRDPAPRPQDGPAAPAPAATGSPAPPAPAPAPAPTPMPAGTTTEIPPNFRGEWNRDLAACGTGRNDTRLRIAATTLRFHESRGRVLTVEPHDERAITVTAAYEGEGQAWERSDRLHLSASGQQLSIDGLTRQRCP